MTSYIQLVARNINVLLSSSSFSMENCSNILKLDIEITILVKELELYFNFYLSFVIKK